MIHERRRGGLVPMISASLEGRLPYMTYPEPWRGPPKQPPEFLRPAPKPVPPTSRFNGVSNAPPNGMRLAPSTRSISKYPSPTSIAAPVNLTQHKDEIVDELPYYRLYPTPPHLSHFPQFTTMYQGHYPPMIRSTFPTTSLQPLETYSPTTPTPITSSTFLPPPSTFSPPSPVKPGQSVLRDKRVPSAQHAAQNQQAIAFKVPSGKEGSLKHRILTRPEDARNPAPLDLQKIVEAPRKRLNAATLSPPPRSPKKTLNNNNTPPSNFTKGSLIQLANGELRKIEDMRTEDFVSSADHSPELRLAESTVVKIEPNPVAGTATITLSYNQRRTQVEVESSLEHPFFVFGQGWASCAPERTQQYYQLKVHRLQVGDILISLTPREQQTPVSSRTTTIMTTATSTAMTVRQLPLDTAAKMHHEADRTLCNQMQPINLHSVSLDNRKRSHDQICDEEDRASRRHRMD